MPFTIAAFPPNYLDVNLTKLMIDPYTEHYKTRMKEVEEDTNKKQDILCLRIGRITIVKMAILP